MQIENIVKMGSTISYYYINHLPTPGYGIVGKAAVCSAPWLASLVASPGPKKRVNFILLLSRKNYAITNYR